VEVTAIASISRWGGAGADGRSGQEARGMEGGAWSRSRKVEDRCDRPPLKKQGFVSQDHIGGFLTKRIHKHNT
jgi:hypothetical protein